MDEFFQPGSAMDEQNFYKVAKPYFRPSKIRKPSKSRSVETIDSDTSAPKRRKLNDKLCGDKVSFLNRSMEILSTKPEEHAEDEDSIFGKIVVVSLIRINPYQDVVVRKNKLMMCCLRLKEYKKPSLCYESVVFSKPYWQQQ